MDVAASLARPPERRDQRLVPRERAVRDRLVHPGEILEEDPPGADREMADLRVAHLPGRQPDGLARRRQRRRADTARQSASNTGVSASSTAFPGPGGAIPQPSRMTRTTGVTTPRRRRRQIASNDVDVERGAADERAVDVGLARAATPAFSGFTEPP